MTVKECVCCEKGKMSRTTTTHHTTYQEQDLTLLNVQLWKCEYCEEGIYDIGYLRRTILHAKKVYDETGKTTINVSNNQ